MPDGEYFLLGCGHPGTALVTPEDGEAYCRMCREAEQLADDEQPEQPRGKEGAD